MKRPAKRRKASIKKSQRTSLETISKFGLKLVHHRHTGRRVHRHHTNYVVLFFLLAFTGAALLLAGVSVKAGPPQSSTGDINLSGIVPGDPPGAPAVILEPKSGLRVNVSTIQIKGTCEPQEQGRAIEIFRNAAFAGSTPCSPAGEFEIVITLVPGKNEIVAKTVDWVGQYGPDSGVTVIFYDVPVDGPNTSIITFPPLQFFTTDHIFKGINRNKEHPFRYHINGGKPAYAVTADWGDGSRDDVVSLSRGGEYQFTHTYSKAGLYKLTFNAVDFFGSKATFQIIVVVNETVTPPHAGTGPVTPSEVCPGEAGGVGCVVTSWLAEMADKLWPAFIVASLMTLSFWFGERVMYMHYFKHRRAKA